MPTLGDCQPDFSGVSKELGWRGPPVSGITHSYKMTKNELQSALAEATQTDKRTLGALAYKEIKKESWICLTRFGQAGEAEKESAHGF
jgi:hypothetical protein